ncbi:MAG TPA: SRPBCC family protein [Terriglobales bacterium]|nr:SRPBCC family protein [Terriglobales bacterium]
MAQQQEAATKLLTLLTLLSLALLLEGCGPSLDALNGMAASGSIDAKAPVTARLELQIAAPPSKVWALLVDAPSWPKWQKQIESVTAEGPLRSGMRFSWKTGGTSIHSQVQLFDPERRLAWTGTALTAKAIHVWQLKLEPGNRTLVTVEESMDGLLMAQIFPSNQLAESEKEWALALKRAAENTQQ